MIYSVEYGMRLDSMQDALQRLRDEWLKAGLSRREEIEISAAELKIKIAAHVRDYEAKHG